MHPCKTNTPKNNSVNNTKEKIIQAAIELFNQFGLVNVRIQDIAQSAGISPGNLTYHFNTKSDLVKGVYKEMLKALDQMTIGSMSFVIGTEGWDMTIQYFIYMERFRFFYLDTLEIIRAYPDIHDSHKKQIELELEIIENNFKFAVEKGYMNPPAISNQHYYLSNHVWITLNFWLSQGEIKGQENSGIDDGIIAIAHIIYPYLTDKGVAVFEEAIAKIKALAN